MLYFEVSQGTWGQSDTAGLGNTLTTFCCLAVVINKINLGYGKIKMQNHLKYKVTIS